MIFLPVIPHRHPASCAVCLRTASPSITPTLDREERRIIEEHFRKRDTRLRVIVATTTLAMGVNTPASAVVIVGLQHPSAEGPQPYSVAEYKNLVGRAGRLGYAERGASYLIATSPREENEYWQRYVSAQPENLASRFLAADPRTLIIRVLGSRWLCLRRSIWR